jgi:class 3 adenylate cyclase
MLASSERPRSERLTPPADVAVYSLLMGADEEGTHQRLKAHLRELIEPKIGEHRGRIVKNTGDGHSARRAYSPRSSYFSEGQRSMKIRRSNAAEAEVQH